jgi:hypothetical protein
MISRQTRQTEGVRQAEFFESLPWLREANGANTEQFSKRRSLGLAALVLLKAANCALDPTHAPSQRVLASAAWVSQCWQVEEDKS